MTFITIIRLAIAAACILLLDQFGVWVWLVAHPFWNFQGVVIGIVAGIVVLLAGWLVFRNRSLGRMTILSLSLLAILVSAGVAMFGKSGFAESFGEDRVSGIWWYYGYLSLTTSTFIGIFGILDFIFNRNKS